MHTFRRLVTRWESHIENFLGFVQLAESSRLQLHRGLPEMYDVWDASS
jgi:hypothetical protein